MNKLGFHVARPDDRIIELAQKLQPKVIKVLDFSPDFLLKLAEVSPNTVFIGRIVLTPQAQDDYLKDPVNTARSFAHAIASQPINMNYVFPMLWEGLNEVFSEQAPQDRQDAYNIWMVEFYDAMRREELTPIAFNFATGNYPNPSDPNQFALTYAETIDKYTHFGFHEYDWPTMDRLHTQGILDGNAGMWLCLRYRRMWDAFKGVLDLELDDKEFWVTETGMTQGVQGMEDVGWLAEPKVLSESYRGSLRWYNARLREDSYIKGACIFTTIPGPDWDTFETTDQLEQLWKEIG